MGHNFGSQISSSHCGRGKHSKGKITVLKVKTKSKYPGKGKPFLIVKLERNIIHSFVLVCDTLKENPYQHTLNEHELFVTVSLSMYPSISCIKGTNIMT